MKKYNLYLTDIEVFDISNNVNAIISYIHLIRGKSYQLNTAMHVHNMYELHIVLSGKSCMEIENFQRLSLEKGDIVFIPPLLNHKIAEPTNSFNRISISFVFADNSGNIITNPSVLGFSPHHCKCIKCTPFINKITDIVNKILDEGKENYAKMIVIQLQCILLEVINQLRSAGDNLNDSNSLQKMHYSIARIAKTYINDNIKNEMTSEKVAVHMNFSLKQLNRIFKEIYLISIFEYIRIKKLSIAKELLLSTEKTIKEIAATIGYSDEYTFSKAFKKSEHISPAQYRKINKINKNNNKIVKTELKKTKGLLKNPYSQ